MKELCPKCKTYALPGTNCDKCGTPIPGIKKLESLANRTQPPPKEPNKKLFSCHDCGAIISRSANACPVCGTKIKNIVTKAAHSILQVGCGLIALAILTPIVYGVFISIFGGKPQKQEETQSQKIEQIETQKQERIQQNASELNLSVKRYKDAVKKYGEPPSSGGVILAKYYLIDHYLNDPDSLKMGGYKKLILGPDGWHGFVEYRAKNSFGGYVRESKRFVIRNDKIVSFE